MDLARQAVRAAPLINQPVRTARWHPTPIRPICSDRSPVPIPRNKYSRKYINIIDYINSFVYIYRMKTNWIDRLSPEDLSFLKRFVLASGSLKAIAKSYSISYPTVRLRLDRLIQKIEIFDSDLPMSEFERQLRASYADGRLDLQTLEQLLNAFHEDQNANAAIDRSHRNIDADIA